MTTHNCPDCGRDFLSEESLEQHIKDKHSKRPEPFQGAKETRIQYDRQTKKKNKFKFAIPIAVFLIVILAASVYYSGGNITGNSVSTSTENSVQTTSEPLADLNIGLNIGQLGPDFTLQDPANGVITKNTFQGRPLFIFFTTTYCVPCQIGAQNLARYDDETGGNTFNVLIVFVDEGETDSQFLTFKENFGRSDWYVAKGIEMAQTYKVQYLDTKYVFDKNGIIKWFDVRPLEYSTTKSILQPLVS